MYGFILASTIWDELYTRLFSKLCDYHDRNVSSLARVRITALQRKRARARLRIYRLARKANRSKKLAKQQCSQRASNTTHKNTKTQTHVAVEINAEHLARNCEPSWPQEETRIWALLYCIQHIYIHILYILYTYLRAAGQ